VFVSCQQTLGFEGWFTLGNTIKIESLGYGKRLRLWVELGGKLILVTHWYLFCKVTHHYSETDGCSLPQTRSIWTVLGQQISCVLSSSLLLFSTIVCVELLSTLILVAWLTCSTHQVVIGVIFHRIHNKSVRECDATISHKNFITSKIYL